MCRHVAEEVATWPWEHKVTVTTSSGNVGHCSLFVAELVPSWNSSREKNFAFDKDGGIISAVERSPVPWVCNLWGGTRRTNKFWDVGPCWSSRCFWR